MRSLPVWLVSLTLLASTAMAQQIEMRPPAPSEALRKPQELSGPVGTLQEVVAPGKASWSVYRPHNLECAVKDDHTLLVTIPDSEVMIFCVLEGGSIQVVVITPSDKPIVPPDPITPVIVPEGWLGLTRASYDLAVANKVTAQSAATLETIFRRIANEVSGNPGKFNKSIAEVFVALDTECRPVAAANPGANAFLLGTEKLADKAHNESGRMRVISDSTDFLLSLANGLAEYRKGVK